MRARALLVGGSIALFATGGCRSDGRLGGSPDASLLTPTTSNATALYVDAMRTRFVVGYEGLQLATIAPGEASDIEARAAGFVPVFHQTNPSQRSTTPALTLPRNADEAFTLVHRDVAIEVKLLGALPARGEATHDAVVYPSAIAGATWVHVPLLVGDEEYFVYPSRPLENELRYELSFSHVAGLRLVSGVLELLEADGNPVLRTRAPTIVDADGRAREGSIAVEGCVVDRDEAPPWGRAPIAPKSSRCTVVTRWSDEGLSYPLLVDPAWTTTNVLATPRFKHRAASITGSSAPACSAGCVLVTGGLSASATVIGSCELYNAAAGTWAAVADMPIPTGLTTPNRHSHALIDTAEGRAVVAGGAINSGGSGTTAASAIFSPGGAFTAGWTALPDLPGGKRANLAAARTDNGATHEIVVTGGDTAGPSTATKAVDRYTVGDAAWRVGGIATLAIEHSNHAMGGFTYLGQSYYVVAGGITLGSGGPMTGAIESIGSAQLLTATTWTTSGTGLSTPRKALAAVVLSDGVLFAGGTTSSGTYSPNIDKFKFATFDRDTGFTTTLSIARSNLVGIPVGTSTVRALFPGGEVSTSPFTGSTKSDLVAADGTLLSGDMTYPRSFHQASRLPGGSALVTGGYQSFNTATSVVVFPSTEELYRPETNGTACGSDFDCDSGHCADGVCCATTCTGQCQSCSLAASKGTCSTITSGNSPRLACDKFGTICGSSCDGTFPDKCHYAASSVKCGDASCATGSETHVAYCDAAGGCTPATTAPCDPYVCGPSACLTACTIATDCANGYSCDTSVGSATFHKCIPTKGGGSACGVTADCKAGLFCVDGVCCATSSCPGGQHCNIAPAAGACKLPYGATCNTSTAAQCATGNCVDGLCCDTACLGQCEACDGSTPGRCAAIAGKPHGGRTACGGTGNCQAQCDGATRASCGAYPSSATPCASPTCTGGVSTPGSTCNGLGACSPVSSSSCMAYACGATSCKTSCAGTADCAAGYFCSGTTCSSTGANGTACGSPLQCTSGNCVDGVCCSVASCGSGLKCSASTDGTCKKPVGTTCGGDGECGSNHCVDSICCDKACSGQCEACNVAGSEGACSPVAGPPHGTRTACVGAGVCRAQCDGSNRVACGAPPGTSTPCAAASCSSTTLTPTAYCDGLGACTTPTTSSCSPYVCGASACKSPPCTSIADCASGYACKDGVCTTIGDLGTVCTDDTQCKSTHCTDAGGAKKVCCTVSKCDLGSACADVSAGAAAGTCVKTIGQKCGAAIECTSGFCVDGVCCESLCSGQCEACNVGGAPGKCNGVNGDPVGTTRPKCDAGGSNVCKALACDGTKDRTKCVGYANGPTVSCGLASCTAGVATEAPTCDGLGACSTPKTKSCDPYTCSDTACNTKCVDDAGCIGGYGCDLATGKCAPKAQSKCSDDGTQAIPQDKTKPPKDCAPYVCNTATNDCRKDCATSSDCAQGSTCDGAACVPSNAKVVDAGSSGCGCTTAGAPRASMLAWISLLGLLSALARRRRARPIA